MITASGMVHKPHEPQAYRAWGKLLKPRQPVHRDMPSISLLFSSDMQHPTPKLPLHVTPNLQTLKLSPGTPAF